MFFSSLRDRARSDEGFTLIELLVVILIIGILATLAIPRFLGQRDSANDTKAKNAVRTAISTAESEYAQSQSYANLPTNFANIETSVTFDATTATWPGTINPSAVFTGNNAPTANAVILCAESTSTKTFCAYLTATGSTKYYTGAKGATLAASATAVAASSNSTGW